eukprot:jgi/Botrbrau1/8759/Bobra.0090s0031.1
MAVKVGMTNLSHGRSGSKRLGMTALCLTAEMAVKIGMTNCLVPEIWSRSVGVLRGLARFVVVVGLATCCRSRRHAPHHVVQSSAQSFVQTPCIIMRPSMCNVTRPSTCIIIRSSMRIIIHLIMYQSAHFHQSSAQLFPQIIRSSACPSHAAQSHAQSCGPIMCIMVRPTTAPPIIRQIMRP